jgi:hypothetical protein
METLTPLASLVLQPVGHHPREDHSVMKTVAATKEHLKVALWNIATVEADGMGVGSITGTNLINTHVVAGGITNSAVRFLIEEEEVGEVDEEEEVVVTLTDLATEIIISSNVREVHLASHLEASVHALIDTAGIALMVAAIGQCKFVIHSCDIKVFFC